MCAVAVFLSLLHFFRIGEDIGFDSDDEADFSKMDRVCIFASATLQLLILVLLATVYTI